MAITLKQGEVVEYPYLWHWQQERGETGGRKDRPACLALILPKDGVTHVVLLAVTGTPPGKDRAAIAIKSKGDPGRTSGPEVRAPLWRLSGKIQHCRSFAPGVGLVCIR